MNSMIGMIREIFENLLVIMAVLVPVVLIIFTVVWLFPPAAVSDTESRFRAACDATNGKTVWNGKHWECWK